MSRGSPDFQPWNAVQRFAATGGATPYEQKATIAAAVIEAGATSTIMVLSKGFVSHVWLKFPTGSVGLMHIAIYNEATKLWPGVAAQWFTGDNEVVEFDCEYDVPLVGGVYKLTIKGWNEDDSYPHSVIARVWVIALP